MVPVDDSVGKHWLEQQLYMMEAQKRILMAGSAGTNNAVGLAYDAGYLAALTELRAMIFNPTPEQRKEQKQMDELDEFDESELGDEEDYA
jgi:hypothetical protein